MGIPARSRNPPPIQRKRSNILIQFRHCNPIIPRKTSPKNAKKRLIGHMIAVILKQHVKILSRAFSHFPFMGAPLLTSIIDFCKTSSVVSIDVQPLLLQTCNLQINAKIMTASPATFSFFQFFAEKFYCSVMLCGSFFSFEENDRQGKQFPPTPQDSQGPPVQNTNSCLRMPRKSDP